jgi:single stranded DNA-binding protein
MHDLNEVVLSGRLAHDPELEYTRRGTPVLEMRLACTSDYKARGGREKVEFIRLKLWRHEAEKMAELCDRGMFIAVTGRLTVDRWRDDMDEVHERVYVYVRTWKILEAQAQTQRRRKKRSETDPNCPPCAMPLVRVVKAKIGHENNTEVVVEKGLVSDVNIDDVDEIADSGDEQDEFPGWDDVE